MAAAADLNSAVPVGGVQVRILPRAPERPLIDRGYRLEVNRYSGWALAMAGGFSTDPRAIAVVNRAAFDLRSSEVQTAIDSIEWVQAKFGSFPTADSGETAFRMLVGVPAEPWDSHEQPGLL